MEMAVKNGFAKGAGVLPSKMAGKGPCFFRCRGSPRSGGRRIAGAAAIGTSSSKAFKGHFDGDDHTVKGLNIEKEVDYQGLFGYVQNTDNGNRAIDEGYRKSGSQSNN